MFSGWKHISSGAGRRDSGGWLSLKECWEMSGWKSDMTAGKHSTPSSYSRCDYSSFARSAVNQSGRCPYGETLTLCMIVKTNGATTTHHPWLQCLCLFSACCLMWQIKVNIFTFKGVQKTRRWVMVSSAKCFLISLNVKCTSCESGQKPGACSRTWLAERMLFCFNRLSCSLYIWSLFHL